jgi:glycosyltransferase involved in cell wall biosynthesis
MGEGQLNTQSSPRISVVIPTRSRPTLVQRAVTSALGQTERDIEVIVIVDGPDEQTIKELSRIADPRLVTVPLKQSVGGAEARNVGIRCASGTWIALLDDDDEWFPKKLEIQYLAALENGSADVVVTSKYLVRRTGKPEAIRPRRLPKAQESISEYMFEYLCYFQTSTYFCSKSLFLKVPFRKELTCFQDIDWFLRVMTTDDGLQLVIIPEPLAIYYEPEDRVTITSNLGWKKRLAWGQDNRNRMTRKAYSRFIVGSCVGRAVQDKAGLPGLVTLLRESVSHGAPSLSNLLLMLGMFIVTPSFRRTIRDTFFLPHYKSSRS